jgi:hypothetical protein
MTVLIFLDIHNNLRFLATHSSQYFYSTSPSLSLWSDPNQRKTHNNGGANEEHQHGHNERTLYAILGRRKTYDQLGIKSAEIKKIRISRSLINSSVNTPTKMYLIKNDEVEILEEKGEWLKVRYYGKKTIEGWIKKSDVE